MYNDINIFSDELIKTYKCIIDLLRFKSEINIINKKRKDTYLKSYLYSKKYI